MCVKTKTEWSCGCYKKSLCPCEQAPSSHTPCSQVDKYRYLDDGDCKSCKAGGANVTRGQDGLGRHAREIAAREKKSKRQTHSHSTRAVLGEITGNGSQAESDNPITPIVTPDPWMKPTRREKKWESPHRRHADEEWEREHARRKEDIESLWESHSASPKRMSRSQRAATAPQPQAIEYDYEVEDSLVHHHARRNSGSNSHSQSNSLQSRIRQINETMARSSQPHRSRNASFESIESVQSRGRSRTIPYKYGYATEYGYAVEDRAPKGVHAGEMTVVYRRR